MYGILPGTGWKENGNFYEDMVRITTRILIPASFIVGLLLVSQGTPQTLQGNFTIETLEGNFQDIAVGPVALWNPLNLERMVVVLWSKLNYAV